MALVKFRDSIREISPRWLAKGLAEKVLYAIAVHFDLLGDAAVDAVRRRFPGEEGNDALHLIGRDRKIPRGPNEPASDYVGRLLEWLETHKRRGNPYVMLEQLFGFWKGTVGLSIAKLLYRSGRRFTLDFSDGSIARDEISSNLDGESDVAHWYLTFDPWHEAFTNDGKWGDGAPTWGDDAGLVWGSGLTIDKAAEVTRVPAEWNAAHADGTIILTDGNAELWGEAGSWNPLDGKWGEGEVAYLQVPSP